MRTLKLWLARVIVCIRCGDYMLFDDRRRVYRCFGCGAESKQ